MFLLLSKVPLEGFLPLSLPSFTSTPRTLRLFCFNFKNDARQENVVKLMDEWQKLKAKWKQEGTKFCGSWLEEHDYSRKGSKEPAEVQEKAFYIFAFGETDTRELENQGRDLTSLLFGASCTTMIKDLPLSTLVDSRPQQTTETQVSPRSDQPTVDSLVSLLMIPPHRRFSENTGIHYNLDSAFDKSEKLPKPVNVYSLDLTEVVLT
ncbi:hypothetical protein F5884DRAFT_865435 [Xylogone sp. PMI_703]|nr:hypothetical protein F5884DRAFT_865435 [Xylogone sp. PMI_703]